VLSLFSENIPKQFEQNDISMTVSGGSVIIKGKKEHTEREERKVSQGEMHIETTKQVNFYRKMKLPSNAIAQSNAVRADVKDGVLCITVQKKL